MEKSQIAIIIPSFEPDEKLPLLVRKLRAQLPNRIILVDDGSDPVVYRQFFQESAMVPDVTLLRHEEGNRGKGRALKTAFSYCLEHQIPGAVTADSDGQHLPEDISLCMDKLVACSESLVLGVRNFKGRGIPFKSRFGNLLTCWIFWLLTFRRLSDTQTGLRGISADFMRILLDVPGERFEFETQMLWKAKCLNIPYREVEISTVYEDGNKGTHFRPIQDSWKIYKALFGAPIKQFFLFVGSGIFSFLVDIGLFSLLFYVLLPEIEGFPKLLFSVVFARGISIFVNYGLNRNVVFNRKSGKLHDWPSLTKYLSLCIVIMLSSYLLTKGATLVFPEGNVVLFKCIVDAFLFVFSFTVQKLIVFKAPRNVMR